ncbi:MAG: enolase C-terminal domain-like protein [Desulfobacterales bacterium]
MTKTAAIEKLDVKAYRVPTDKPESDGTLRWDATTMVTVHVQAGGKQGFGYSYTAAGAVTVIRGTLGEKILGIDAFDIPRCWALMTAEIRNMGESGIARMAVAAVEVALWDLKAKLLGLPLVTLLGRVRDKVAVYGSGGFTSYTNEELQAQLAGWVADGIPRVKMKIGRDPEKDPARIRAAREAIGEQTALFVDANGGYDRKQALAMADRFSRLNVTWYEEPVSQKDAEGLRFIRERVPPVIEVTAGEYGFLGDDFRILLQSGAVDVLMADITRCGITGYLQAAALCAAHHIPLSSHCAPALHLHPSCALAPVRHMEYFHDHVRIEHMLLEGVSEPVDGFLAPDLSRPGIGLELKTADAEKYAITV